MKKLLPIVFIAGVVFIFFRQFFISQLLPIPSDTIVGLYNPYRDLYAKEYPRGIPFKNFLITDPVRQEYPWRFESILQEKKLQLPLWNPYNFAGTPLLANQQSAPLYPLNLLFFILPFSLSWSLLIFLQQILGGIFFYLYLRNRKVHDSASILGAVSFIFSGFFTVWLEWGTVDSVLLWLPLLLLAIDHMFQPKFQRKWYSIYFLSLCFSFFAGHLQTFFYIFLFSHSYLAMQWIRKRKSSFSVVWFGLSALAAGIVTSISWLPLFQFIFYSARESDLVITTGWFLPWQHLLGFFTPDFFGNPTTLNYWGVWNYAELTGYVGIAGIFFALYALFTRKDTLTWFYALWIFLALLFALPTPLAKLPLQLHIPLLSTGQPTRLLSLIDFSLSILAALGLDYFITNGKRIFIPIVFFTCFFASLWAVIIFHAKMLPQVPLIDILVAKHNLIFSSALLGVVIIFIISAAIVRKKKILFILCILCLLVVSAIDNIRFAEKFTPFTKSSYLFPQTSALQFLQAHVGNYRITTTSSQILPPNFSLMYHIQSLDGYDPLYINNYGELIAAMERNAPDIHAPFGFNRIITPHLTDSRLLNLLGVKYILSLSTLHQKNLQRVFTEGQTQVYENTSVFPRAFFVNNVVFVKNNQEAASFLFNKKNDLLRTASVLQYPKNNSILHSGTATILSYQDNQVIIKTKNTGNGFLVLSDTYYPTWHASIDGKKAKIYSTDLAIRGVFVPKGTHTVQFTVQLF